MIPEGSIKLGVMDIKEAEFMRSHLRQDEAELTFIHNQETCNTGCGISVEVWVKETDLPKVGQFFKAQKVRAMAGLEFDSEVVNSVHDATLSEATCPACTAKFSTDLEECPDCGLGFSGLK